MDNKLKPVVKWAGGIRKDCNAVLEVSEDKICSVLEENIKF